METETCPLSGIRLEDGPHALVLLQKMQTISAPAGGSICYRVSLPVGKALWMKDAAALTQAMGTETQATQAPADISAEVVAILKAFESESADDDAAEAHLVNLLAGRVWQACCTAEMCSGAAGPGAQTFAKKVCQAVALLAKRNAPNAANP